jgi:hypothetical protein
MNKETPMKTFEVHGIEIAAPASAVFEFVRRPENLPKWAHAFKSADSRAAQLQTPSGAVGIGLTTSANADAGTIDWTMAFPDGSIGIAQSRVTATARDTSIYSFVLHAPPVPLEQIEGALEYQARTLRTELVTLKKLVEAT